MKWFVNKTRFNIIAYLSNRFAWFSSYLNPRFPNCQLLRSPIQVVNKPHFPSECVSNFYHEKYYPIKFEIVNIRQSHSWTSLQLNFQRVPDLPSALQSTDSTPTWRYPDATSEPHKTRDATAAAAPMLGLMDCKLYGGFFNDHFN